LSAISPATVPRSSPAVAILRRSRAGLSYFESWTDDAPFVYGRPGRTIQEALDNLEAAVLEAESRRRAS
jgi:hypothetical protein